MEARSARLRKIRKLALLLTALSFLILLVSAYIRLNGAGLGCSPWPHCYGQLLVGGPYRHSDEARIIHRVVASSALLLGFVLAWQCQRPQPIQPAARYASALLVLMIVLTFVGIWSADPHRAWASFINILGGAGLVLLAWRTVLRNVMLPVEVRRLDRASHLERARQLLNTAGLNGFENKYPWQLSGGMQQRAAICRALVHDPKIVLMDEPFGALDAMTREKMNLELQRIHFETKKTILLITHSIPEAIFLADRVVVMTDRPGSVAAIYDVPLPRPRALDMMASPIFAELTKTIRGHFYARGHLD